LEFIDYIIPFERIAAMSTGPQVLLILVIIGASLAVLTKGADWLVDGAAQLAYRLGISKIIVGATVVSLGTTTPETAVSVLAALRGEIGIALGNAVGSVICDTGLIFGLGCLLTRLPLDRFILNRHGWLQFGSGLLLVFLVVISTAVYGAPVITRPMGVMLLCLLAGYMFISIRWARNHPNPPGDIPAVTHSVTACMMMIIVGVFMVVFSAQALIRSVALLCNLLGIPEAVVAATVVAFGTSLPELVTALTSIRKGHPEIMIGNIVGADILNVLFVTGASAAAVALPVPAEVLRIHLPTMILILLLFRIFIYTSRDHFRRWYGIPLLAIYAAFIIVSYFARGIVGL